MAILTIKGDEYEAKCSFAFEKLANEKYSKKDEKNNDMGGFMTIYMNLLEYSNDNLVAFWDCALKHQKKSVSIKDIEVALEERIDEDGDTEKLFQEAFEAIDNAGFFKKRASNFWRDLETLKSTGKDDAEKEANLKLYERLQSSRKELQG